MPGSQFGHGGPSWGAPRRAISRTRVRRSNHPATRDPAHAATPRATTATAPVNTCQRPSPGLGGVQADPHVESVPDVGHGRRDGHEGHADADAVQQPEALSLGPNLKRPRDM
jgi:hypothetical protein